MNPESMISSQSSAFNTDTLLDSLLQLPQLKELLYKPRFIQRLKVSREWAIAPGQKLLDIGCGQGESCLVLAREGGPSTLVTGIDTCKSGMLKLPLFSEPKKKCERKVSKS